MKVLVISDIHGSSYYADKIKEITKKCEQKLTFLDFLFLVYVVRCLRQY